MDENYITWFAVVQCSEKSDPKHVDVAVYDTISQAEEEQEMFGGIILEVRTEKYDWITPDAWKRSIALKIADRVLNDPQFLNTRQIIDLRLE